MTKADQDANREIESGRRGMGRHDADAMVEVPLADDVVCYCQRRTGHDGPTMKWMQRVDGSSGLEGVSRNATNGCTLLRETWP